MSFSRSQRNTADRRRRIITHGLHGHRAPDFRFDEPEENTAECDAVAAPDLLATTEEAEANPDSDSDHTVEAAVIDAAAEQLEAMIGSASTAARNASVESTSDPSILPQTVTITETPTAVGTARPTVVAPRVPRPSGIAPPVSPTRFAPVRETAGLLAVRKLLQSRNPLTWTFTGDNLAHGAEWTQGARSATEHFAERIRFELKRGFDTVINTGMHGDTARHLLKTLKYRALRYQSEVVSVSLGMIDSKGGIAGLERFRRNLREILDQIRNAGSIPVLQTPNLIHFPAVRNRSALPAYVEVLREEAHRVELPLIDHWAHWQRQIPDEETLLFWLADGRIHPGVYGHRELAKLLFHELGLFDPASPTCRHAVP